MVLVVEDPLHPVGSVHVNEKGGVPPPAVAVQVKGLPAVAAPQLTLVATGWPVTLTVAEALCETMLASFAELLMM